MRRPITVPDLGPSGMKLSVWFVQPGETVYAGDRLVELLIDDATFDISSPGDGKLLEKSVHPGDPVTAGQTVGFFEED